MQEVAHPEANIIFGAVIDDALGDQARVTVIAAGFDSVSQETNANNSSPAQRQAENTRATFGGDASRPSGLGRSPQRGGSSYGAPATGFGSRQNQDDDIPDDAGFDVDLPAESDAPSSTNSSGRKDSLDFPDFLK